MNHEETEDESGHIFCSKCGFCIECNDCKKYGCGSHNTSKENNPAHYCMGDNCKKFLGHRGFCSTKCHDSHYDGMSSQSD